MQAIQQERKPGTQPAAHQLSAVVISQHLCIGVGAATVKAMLASGQVAVTA